MSQATEQIARQFANANANKVTWNGVMLNVKTYGAVGDGVTDDTAAFRAAIAYMSSHTDIKTLYLPTGNYLITDSVDIGLSKITIEAENAQTYISFRPTTSKDCFYVNNSTNNTLVIRGLNFIPLVALTSGAMIHITSATQCVIEDCQFLQGLGGYYAIWLEKTLQCEIRNNSIQGGYNSGIRVESNDSLNPNIDTFIRNNYIQDCNIFGIAFNEYCNGIFVRENVLYRNGTNLLLSCSAVGNMFSIMIQNNDLDSATNKGLGMTRVNNFQVTDNWCATSESYSVHLDLCSSGLIVGNLIYPKVTGAQTNFGIYLEGCSLINATGNTIAGGDGGIRIDKTNLVATTSCKGINFSGNTVADNPLGVHLYNNAPVSKGVNVVANIFQNVTTPVGDGGTLNLVNVNNNSYV